MRICGGPRCKLATSNWRPLLSSKSLHAHPFQNRARQRPLPPDEYPNGCSDRRMRIEASQLLRRFAAFAGPENAVSPGLPMLTSAPFLRMDICCPEMYHPTPEIVRKVVVSSFGILTHAQATGHGGKTKSPTIARTALNSSLACVAAAIGTRVKPTSLLEIVKFSDQGLKY